MDRAGWGIIHAMENPGETRSPETPPRRIVIAEDLGERWLGLMEGSQVRELTLLPEERDLWLGTIFKGRVSQLAAGMGGAFVDVGLGSDLFLVEPDRPGDGDDPLRAGGEVLVQVVREAAGGKGHRGTREIMLAGTRLILGPGGRHRGVSRRIAEETERDRLREIVETIAPEGFGVIVRTAAEGVPREILEADIARLIGRWEEIAGRAEKVRAPSIVYREQDPLLPFLRDCLADRPEEVIVESAEMLEGVTLLLQEEAPGMELPVHRHGGPLPLLEAYGFDRAAEQALRPEVPLGGGGSLVIQQTEAMVSIDVNSGTDMSGEDLEETALQTNLEAAAEAARQVRLRGLAGLIVVDFIDMRRCSSREAVFQALSEGFASDRARVRILPPTEFCLGQVSRQRRRAGLARILGRPCPGCGRTLVASPGWKARSLLRRARVLARSKPEGAIIITADEELLSRARRIAERFGEASGISPGRLRWRAGERGVTGAD